MRVLMTHLYYGDPDAEFSLKLAETLLNARADILEVGIPYTDPVCDGEVFQRACKRALENGTTPFEVLEGIRRIRGKGYGQKIYLTSYYAPIFKIGLEKFVKLAKDAGVNGLIVPDLLLEEQEGLKKAIERVRPLGLLRSDPEFTKFSVIQFATVYSSKERLRQIVRESRDFIYCASLPGVTGDQVEEKGRLPRLLKSLKSMTKISIFVGFGIKSKEDARKIMGMGADGVIVGSAVARIYEKNLKKPFETLSQISAFIKHLKESTI